MTFRWRWIGVLGGLVLIGSVRDAADQSLWRGLVVARNSAARRTTVTPTLIPSPWRMP